MKKIFIYSAFTIMALFTSCSDYLDVNTDPNNPTEVDPSLVLPSAEAQIAGVLNGYYGVLGGIWSQHWTQSHVASQYRNEDAYGLTKSDYNVAWRELYSDVLIDLSVIRKSAEETENWNAYLQATSLMAYTYQVLADFYGQIPFSEALLGNEGINEPVFDSGQDVYDGLIVMLDEALSKDFAGEGNTWIQTDFVFGDMGLDGQIDSWIRFANTLKLKIYLRQTEARSTVAQEGITKILNGESLLTTDAALDIFEDVADRSYPLYETNIRQLNVSTNLRGSHTFITYLLDNEDPRIDAFFIAGSGGHFGLRQGDFDALSTDIAPDAPDVAIFEPTTAFYLFTTEEVNFMLAEAHLRYGNSGDVIGFYNAGVMQSCARHGVNGDGLVSDGGSYAYPDGSFDDNLQAIMMQKWVSMVERGYESFFDQNRTGIPGISSVGGEDPNYVPGEFTYSIGGVTNGLFPKRLIFPDLTRRNNSNTPVEQPITEPVWWAK